MNLDIAILSDLHCHPQAQDNKDSYLFSDGLRSPSARHPIQSLIDLISKESIKADVLLVPGDLCSRANRSGLLAAWYMVQEVAQSLGTSDIVVSPGNHDVLSRR